MPTKPYSDDTLYKMWWYATLYGASPSARMRAMDERRKECVNS